MPKNRSNRQAKIARQRRARAHRDLTQQQDTLTAFTLACATGSLPMACPGGQTRHLTLARITDWFNEGLARDGEPPLEDGELNELLSADLLMGRFRLRPDGLWESDDDYFEDRSEA